uniref:Uncharacterized protein n=1 Tax=Trichuris muris TaxID=70415 RepID=A0A5S6QH94_TRIMR
MCKGSQYEAEGKSEGPMSGLVMPGWTVQPGGFSSVWNVVRWITSIETAVLFMFLCRRTNSIRNCMHELEMGRNAVVN